MATLFISDLHLDPARPDITTQALDFLHSEAHEADALYILGDLFEAWVGDDDPEPEKRRVIAALRKLSDAGLPLYFMHGNRDFLVGARFAAESGCTLLEDPTTIELHGTRVLLMHGDTLCTDDHEYQAFRAMVRNPAWQQAMLARPLPERLALAQQLRETSAASMAGKPMEIMDVNQGAVEAAMRQHGVYTLLHGHTHRPAVHQFELDGHEAVRIVLGDWYTQGSVLSWDAGGFVLRTLPR
ncbi:UDP-2,3-diacylglucosamine diphosphatase [Thioalkalivibrio sp. XN279]|uniref:UDP-2,3-diacylglucosamine diphosphatase n=1 Tax=Thioalkalivibrio sp. XN279 TaxID=2714953 RepID=UPI001408A3C4|nr:UDP-2,3-diacylglucosamine diphosphatase [Thioalkalivibrio sp. XN279]NHA15515.1 UDP-2,3-diacylglucosamine diphosphatase [Thioalkalivibrio sp. XN279]